MMKEAMFYETLDKMKVQCHLCPHDCLILHGKKGRCHVRENRMGKLYTSVYGKVCAATPDPIEKKPLYHFMPGTRTYSIATPGCNLNCKFCQNWQISQAGPEDVECQDIPPHEIVDAAIRSGCKSIAYTYVEPSIFYEFMLDVAKLARKAGLKNIMVSNGYLNPAPARKLYKYIDAINFDIKAFTDEFYIKQCGGHIKHVLHTIKLAHKMNLWVELTTLIIPGLNDSMGLIKKECGWIKKELGAGVPLHFSRFFPYYHMNHAKPTDPETLEHAYQTAKSAGLDHVYIGNVETEGRGDTYCPKCGKRLIHRTAFSIGTMKVRDGRCSYCGKNVPGVFENGTTRKKKK